MSRYTHVPHFGLVYDLALISPNKYACAIFLCEIIETNKLLHYILRYGVNYNITHFLIIPRLC